MIRSQLQAGLTRLWTVRQLCARFGVSHMTIHNWRTHLGLPALVIPGDARDSVRFIPSEVRRWAREHGKRMDSTAGAGAAGPGRAIRRTAMEARKEN